MFGNKDQDLLERELGEIKKVLEEIRVAIGSGAVGSSDQVGDPSPEEAPETCPENGEEGAGTDMDSGASDELEEAKQRNQELSQKNEELQSKLAATSDAETEPRLDGEIESLRNQNAQLLEDAKRAQEERQEEVERLRSKGVEERQQMQEAAQRAEEEKDKEIESLRSKNVEERQQMQEAAQRAEEEKDKEIESLRSKNVEERQQMQEAAQRAEEEKDKEIESLRSKNVEERQQMQEAAQKAQAEKEGEIERLKAANSDLSRQVAEEASSQRIEDVIWPAFMAEQATSEHRERLKSELHADNPSALAIRLVADLFSYNANHKLKSDKKAPLLSSVHRLGESLFAWLSESNSDPDQIYEKGQAWADLLNRESTDVFKIDVPMIDCEFDRKTMVNYGSGSSSADVRSIQSWCVKDAEGRPQHLAEVTLT